MTIHRSRRAWRVFAIAASLLLLALAGSAGLGSAANSASLKAERVCNRSTTPGVMSCFALARVNASGQIQAAATPSGYGPADIQSAYKLPAGAAPGARSQSSTRTTTRRPSPTSRPTAAVRPAAVHHGERLLPQGEPERRHGSCPRPNTGWGQEIALDLDMVSAACPPATSCSSRRAAPPSRNLGTAVNRAVTMGAVAVSNSYGGRESSSDPSYDSSYYSHAGVAITASSGDDGYGSSYPAGSPYVTAVGGTSLDHASNARGWSETVWSGAGSGCSSNEPKPTWQTRHRLRAADDRGRVRGRRSGDRRRGLRHVRLERRWMVFGGTSASSPIIASRLRDGAATPARRSTRLVPVRAHGRAVRRDLAAATARAAAAYLCTGGAGYDGPTGLGTPNGVAAFGPGGTPANDFSISVSPTSGPSPRGAPRPPPCRRRPPAGPRRP